MILLKHQIDFIKSQTTHTGLVGGFGSGKSISATVKAILRHGSKYDNRVGVDVAYYLPTYSLIKDIAIPNFKKYLDIFNIQNNLNQTDKEFRTPYGKIMFRSLDNPDMIVGYEVGYSVIDEADILPKSKMQDAFQKVVGRNRQIENGQVDFVSTPEGFGFMYDFFVKKESDKKTLIKARSDQNPYLPLSYIETLKENYSEKLIESYLNGEFVNFRSGNVYEFERKRNTTDRTVNEKDILHIGIDFNITNMNAVVHVIDKGVMYAVDEFTEVYDTNSMIERIKERYPRQYIYIYPDASGQNRNTSGKTDVQLLQQAGLKVKVLSKNPFVRDRVNEVNKQLRSGNYLINSKKCPKYVEALEQIGWRGGEPDKTSGYDHETDAGGYFIWAQRSNNFSIRV